MHDEQPIEEPRLDEKDILDLEARLHQLNIENEDLKIQMETNQKN